MYRSILVWLEHSTSSSMYRSILVWLVDQSIPHKRGQWRVCPRQLDYIMYNICIHIYDIPEEYIRGGKLAGPHACRQFPCTDANMDAHTCTHAISISRTLVENTAYMNIPLTTSEPRKTIANQTTII